jgi:D-glycero-D-manno-heptose 1,7-bisphosphate phosphatase
MIKIVFLDRDGTLIEHGQEVAAHRPQDVRLLPGVVDGLKMLIDGGRTLVIATNQPGPAKGQYSVQDVKDTNDALVDLLAWHGIYIARVEVCMHHPIGGPGGDPTLIGPCDCRKPKPGMLLHAMRELSGLPELSYMVGDSTADIGAAKAAGVRAAFVRAIWRRWLTAHVKVKCQNDNTEEISTLRRRTLCCI